MSTNGDPTGPYSSDYTRQCLIREASKYPDRFKFWKAYFPDEAEAADWLLRHTPEYDRIFKSMNPDPSAWRRTWKARHSRIA